MFPDFISFRPGYAGYVYNDPLRYEKTMLRWWFLDRFSASPAAPDAVH